MRSFRRAVNPEAMLVVAVCLWSLAAANVASAAGAPHFSFREGERLTYHYSRHMLAHGGPPTVRREDVEGQVVLQVRRVSSDGTAEIEMVASGKGRVVRDKTTDLTGEPWAIVFDVNRNGSIAALQDVNGNAITLEAWIGAVSAGAMIERFSVALTYALFGLQLPDKLPPAGGEWTGYHQRTVTVGQEESIRLEPVSVRFTFVGPRKYKGRDCLVFSTKPGAAGELHFPTVFYFDNTNGRLVASETHLKKLGASKRDVDISVVLVKVE